MLGQGEMPVAVHDRRSAEVSVSLSALIVHG